MKSATIAFLTVIALSSSAELALAGNTEDPSVIYPAIGQLELRDRKVTITSAPEGYLYSITDESGTILNANLSEDGLAEQYPELLELLQPAIAGHEAEIMMLAPMMHQ